MDAPLNIANQLKPDLDAEAHSHVFSETQEATDVAHLFPLPLDAKDLPLIAWTQIKMTWENAQIEQVMASLVLRQEDQSIVIGDPFPVYRSQWAALPWLLPSIPLTNGILAIQIDPLYENDYVNFKLAGFEQLLERISHYLFVDELGTYKWLYSNCDNGAWIEECHAFEGEEGSYVLLKPLSRTV
jgi:hypothetical protein